MHITTRRIVMAALATLAPSVGYAQSHQHPILHVDPRWKECSFKLDAALTPEAWAQFTREAGLVAYFRPLTDARPLGKGKYELSMLQWETRIDDHDAAWNDTFVHPDSTHVLVEGRGLKFPGLMVRRGMSDRVDVGAFFTKNPNANYGFYGGQVQYNVVRDARRQWAASARVSAVSLFGPEDLRFATVGADLIASRTFTTTSWSTVSPYVSVSHYLANAWERSSVVALESAHETGSMATVGAVARVSVFTIAAEVQSARVASQSLKVGVAF
jgi:hypothetical protein